MKKTIIYSLVSILGLSLLSVVNAENQSHVIQEFGKGSIDWTDKIIKVTGSGAIPSDKPVGQGRLLAERAAISDAYRQISEIVYGVRVNSETTVKDFVVESDIIKTKVDGFIKGAKRGDKKINSDGTIEYELSVPLYGQNALSDAIDLDLEIKKSQKMRMKKSHNILFKYNNKFAFNFNQTNDYFKIANSPDNKNNNCLECHTPHPITDKMKNNDKPKENTNQINNSNENVSGVIIDARGLGLVPAMDPAILDSEMKRVYIGNWEIDADFVVNNGVIGYFTDIDEAKKDISRVGNNPIIIKASSIKNLTDLILEADSANTLVNSDNSSKFLQKYAVNVVM
ncbi:MAG: hypothetical protein U0354_08575 [Candidatus Sericytochromatia bacterium]